MPVTPDALLEAAKALGRGEAEVDRRNAASRAYYAALSPVPAARSEHRPFGRTGPRGPPAVTRHPDRKLGHESEEHRLPAQ